MIRVRMLPSSVNDPKGRAAVLRDCFAVSRKEFRSRVGRAFPQSTPRVDRREGKKTGYRGRVSSHLDRRFRLFPLDFELLFLFGVHFLDYGALIGRSGSLRPTRRRHIAGQGSLTRPVLCGPGSRSFRRRRVVSRCRLDLDGRAEHRENCSCSEIPHCAPPWRLGSRLFKRAQGRFVPFVARNFDIPAAPMRRRMRSVNRLPNSALTHF
jgi:hypothetical protein